ncbi:MAG: hypothetical protein ACRDK4_08000 [Solirubrobacteraceae bacterium]
MTVNQNLNIGKLAAVALAAAFASVLFAIAPAGADAVDSPPLGIESFTMQTTEAEQVVETAPFKVRFEKSVYPFTQAGGHPWALSTTIKFKTEPVTAPGGNVFPKPTRDVKDIVTYPPPGLLGDPNPRDFPRCSVAAVLAQEHCPLDTQIGVARLKWYGVKESLAPIVNVVPEKGQSAEFGVETVGGVTALLTGHVARVRDPTGRESYGLVVVSNEIPDIIELVEAEVTLWGVPADQSHDPMRGVECAGIVGLENCGGGGHKSGVRPVPFLTMPTDCTAGDQSAKVLADSWEEPGSFAEGRYSGYAEETTKFPAVTGCNLLKFEPGIGVQPDTELADAPVGLGIDLTVPQVEANEANLTTPATPQLRDSVVTLPEGLSVNPGVVDGIQACEATGPHGINIIGPESEERGLNGESQLAPGHCPAASTIGEAEAESPLLDEPVKGHVYLAKPGCGEGLPPCTPRDALDGNLYRIYLELGGEGALADAGVNLKVEGSVQANPATGQLTTVFQGTPQLPFSELRIKLNGGQRASLANPPVCGGAVTTSRFTPWSAPGTTPEGLFVAGTPDATPGSEYHVGGCASPQPFAPGFLAGTVTPNAGKFSAFTLEFSREDRQQYVKGIELHTPPGLLADLASVPLCPEAQADDPAANGECTASKIGTTRVASGAGSHPFEIEGSVFLTGPYRGAPFGLSIVTHAVAGPFDLGLVVVRARIDIDPENSTAIVRTDETGPYAIPQVLFGVPLRLKRVTVDVDRPGFMLNPTGCFARRVTAWISGSEDALASVSSPFAVGGCKSLVFKPRFSAATTAHTSRKAGAGLDVKLAYPKGALGNDAGVARVKVDLPRQLPSRLTTLQQACPARTFAADPSACSSHSVVGIARAHTPLLSGQLSGPVYFVSHGGEQFPNLIIVLQGDGVRVDLVGDTFISKAGITSSTFKAIPDVPVESFELNLPQGRYSALAANGDLCRARTVTTIRRVKSSRVHGRTVRRTVISRKLVKGLLMPSEFVAQNGLVFKQSTKIVVAGCPGAKAAARRADATGASR